MFLLFDHYVMGMAFLRLISSAIEFIAAMAMLKFNRVDRALEINAILALVGPLIMLSVTTLGLAGLAGKVQSGKLVLVLAGVALIFYGLRRD